ncbi:MAG TPA: hypothetical protein VFM56_10775, partial [Solimonas sp.]|nr:hypothetical protein [Solimonas sp.]
MTKGWKIAAVAIVVGVVTYVGLEVLLPHHKPDVKLRGLVPADSVFSGKLQAPGEVAAATEATPGSAAADAGATTPSGPAVATDDAMAASDEGSDADQRALVDTTSPGEDDGAANADAQTTTAAAPEAAPAPEPVAPAQPAPAPKPASKPAPAKPAPKPAPQKKPVAKAGKTGPWWESAGNGLHVIYAGSAAFERAIVVMGNAPFASAASANQNIHVSDAAGKAVAGSWKLGANNKSMLVFPVGKAGKFQVAVGAGL